MRKEILIFLVLLSFTSCKKESKEDSNISEENQIEAINPVAHLNSFTVDNLSITDELISNATLETDIGKLTSLDQVWFKNSNSNQVALIGLNTDYSRASTLLFYNYSIPDAVLNRINLYTKTATATLEEKKKHINAFSLNAKEIDETFFESNKKIKLGITKESAIAIYNKPDTLIKSKNLEILKWDFSGDNYLIEHPEEIESNANKIIAKNSFGHKIELFFNENKLIAVYLVNTVP